MTPPAARRPTDDSFPPDVVARLKPYVYRLIDPRNGETFYVGKGRGNRVFSHIRAEQGLEGDEIDNKLRRIRQIRLAGFEVAHVIHRHGIDDKTALEVEAAVMDAYPGLPVPKCQIVVSRWLADALAEAAKAFPGPRLLQRRLPEHFYRPVWPG